MNRCVSSATFEFSNELHTEKIDPVSLTKPDMSFTVRELLERYTSGNMPAVELQGTYEEDVDINEPNPMLDPDFDLADATAKQLEYESLIEDIERKKAHYQKLKDDEQHKQRIKEREFYLKHKKLKEPTAHEKLLSEQEASETGENDIE